MSSLNRRSEPGGAPAAIALAAMLFMLALAGGCASAVSPDEVQQKANPVSGMYQELHGKLEAERDATQWFSYANAVSMAHREDRYAMVVFYTSWCKWCKKLDEETLSDPAVREDIKAGFVPAKVDAESDELITHEMRMLTMTELADLYEVKNYPTVWFLDSSGQKAKPLNGYLPPAEFRMFLRYIKSGAYREMEFEQYVSKGEPAG